MSELMKKLHIKKNNKKISTVQFSVNNETLKYVNVPIQAFMDLCKVLEKLEPIQDNTDDELSDEPWESILSDAYDSIKGDPKYKDSALSVRGARERVGLTQKQLAEKLNMARTNLSLIENAKRPVGKMLAKKLSKVLGINYKVFL
jgi:ribosome-binding protein aMBF1 (putative translation factor)